MENVHSLLDRCIFLLPIYNIEMGKNICVNVTCLGSCNFLISKAT